MYEDLVAEYLSTPLPPYQPRDWPGFDLPVPAQHNLIHAIVGVRRCGKTYLLYQLMDELHNKGVSPRLTLHLSFDDDRIQRDERSASELLDAYYQIVPEARDGCYLFLDEVQEAPAWTAFVRRVSERNRVSIVLTGSSSRLLSTDIPTQLRGRSLAHDLWPLSFAEACRFLGIPTEGVGNAYPATRQGDLARAYRSYLDVGGFPAVQGTPTNVRVQLLQAYANEIVTKDVLERFETASFRAARQFALSGLRSTGLAFSIRRQLNMLRSAGIALPNKAAYALLDDLDDAHLLFKVGTYGRSLSDNPRASRKVYAIDPGLSLAVAPASHLDLGQRLETAVYLDLRRTFGWMREHTIATYASAACPEVDFIVGDVALGEQYELVQVTASDDEHPLLGAGDPRGSKKRHSELGNLAIAMRETGLREATLVTLAETGSVALDEGSIRVVPAWRWSLELAERRRADQGM